MSIQESLQSHIDVLLNDVQADPQHRMSPYRRRELYAAFEDPVEAATQRALCWLAVITAKKVLPIFQQRYPDDTLPQELLVTAISVLQGKIDTEQVEDILDKGCHASAGAWGYDEREIPWPVWQAGNASYLALNEACGYQPLSYLPDYYKGDVLTPWTDEYLCESGVPDTAAAAAIAVSSDRYGRTFDPEKSLMFWRWWLLEAIPQSVEAAHRGGLPVGG